MSDDRRGNDDSDDSTESVRQSERDGDHVPAGVGVGADLQHGEAVLRDGHTDDEPAEQLAGIIQLSGAEFEQLRELELEHRRVVVGLLESIRDELVTIANAASTALGFHDAERAGGVRGGDQPERPGGEPLPTVAVTQHTFDPELCAGCAELEAVQRAAGYLPELRVGHTIVYRHLAAR